MKFMTSRGTQEYHSPMFNQLDYALKSIRFTILLGILCLHILTGCFDNENFFLTTMVAGTLTREGY